MEIVENSFMGPVSRTLLVGNGGFDTIQEAVNAAEAGDTVLVSSGTYREQVTVAERDGLKLIGLSGAVIEAPDEADLVEIDGLRTALLTVTSDDVTVEGFTFDGRGFAATNSNNDSYAAILFDGVTGGAITGNSASGFAEDVGNGLATGILLREATGVTVDGNTLTGFGDDTADFPGVSDYGLTIARGGGHTVTNNSFTDFDSGIDEYEITEQNFVSNSGEDANGYDAINFQNHYVTANTLTEDATYSGSAGTDVYETGSGDDTLSGEGGDDFLIGNGGDDSLDGGAGDDTAAYFGSAADYTIAGARTSSGFLTSFESVTDNNADDGDDGTDALSGVEEILFLDDTPEGTTLNLADKVQLTDADGDLVGTFDTIQAAVDAAEDGYTVTVAAGVYDEDLNFSKAVTVKGAQAGVAAPGRAAASGTGETTLIGDHDITATTGPVVLDGLRFVNDAGTTGGGDAGATLGIANGGGHVVRNSVFYSEVKGGANGVDDRAVFVSPAATGSVTLADNHITGAFAGGFSDASWGRGLWFNGGGVDLELTGNTIEYARTGANLDMFGGSEATISNNSFKTNGTAVSVGVTAENIGFLDNDFTSVGTDLNFRNLSTDTVFDGETAADAVTPGVAGDLFQVWGGTGADTLSGTAGADELNGNQSNNQNTGDADILDGRGGDDLLLGKGGDDRLTGGEGDDTLTGGAGSDTAVYAGQAGGYAVTGTQDADGFFTSFTGVEDTDDSDGDEGTDTLSGVERIEFGGEAVSLVGGVQVIDADGDFVGAFDSIQDAVDASENDYTILVSAGEYVEQVTVAGFDGLTIRGVGDGEVIIRSPASAVVNGDEGGLPVISVVSVNDSSDVTIEGVTIDGAFAGDTTPDSNGKEIAGLSYLGSGGAVVDVVIENVGNSVAGGLFGLQHGYGLVLDANGEEGIAVSVTGSTITNFQKGGVYVDQIALTFTGNTVTGVGATTLTAQNMMQVGRSSGTIGGNTLSGFAYTPDTPEEYYASGIIAYEPSGPLTISGNVITGSGEHSAGVDLSDTLGVSVAITGNTLSNLEFGVYAYTFSGGEIGLDANPVLTGNGFADITGEGVHFAPEESFGEPFSTDTDFDVTGTTFTDYLAGSDGDDSFDGAGGADTLIGDGGDDLLDGGAGADAMAGGSGDDDYVVDDAGDTVTENVNGGVDEVLASISYTLTGAVENLTLTGSAAIDGTGNGAANVITGNAAANTLRGEGGDDTLAGLGGGDTLIGGDGVDTADYSASAAGVQVNLATGTTAGGDAQGDTLSGVENLVGSAAADTLTGDGSVNRLVGGGGGDTLNGGAGIDTMIGGSGDDAYVVDNSADAAIELAGEGDDGVTASVSYTLGANVERLTLTGTGNLNGTGNGGDNVLTGNSGNNTLTGGGGNDRLDGQAGADTMVGGTGDDGFVVGAGDTVVEQAGEGTDEIRTALTSYTLGTNLENLTFIGTGSARFTGTGNSTANTITGGAAADRLDGKGGADRLIGLGGDDSYTVDNTGDVVVEAVGGGTDSVSSGVTYTLGAQVENLTLTGSAAINGTGNDLANRITGNGAANTLTGGEGDDTLDGGNGADSLVGGTGNDTYVVGRPDDVTVELAGEGVDLVLSDTITYTLYDNVENLTLRDKRAITGIGNALANVVTGNVSDNTLEGGAGNDTLDGRGGSDTMRGGADDDTYVVDASGDKALENAGEGTDTVRTSLAGYTLGANLENLVYTGSGSFTGAGNAEANVITGGAGDDTLDGKGGADTLRGLGGNDTYVVDNAGDVIDETSGVDTVITSLNSFTLAVGLENLTFNGTGAFTGTGNAAANRITGGSGDDRLDGGAGADTLIGGAGDDTYLVESSSDVITEAVGGGVDTVETAASSYTLGANVENLTYAGAGAFTGTGNGSANTIRGGALADTLNGGVGADTLIGFDGDDIYVVDDAGDVTVETATGGTDTVRSTAASYTLGADVENIVLLTGGVNATGNGLNNALTGNSGNNTLDGGAGADTMTGGTGNDIYVVDNVGDVAVEGSNAGTDTVRTSLANYQLGSANLENLTYTGTGNFTGTGNSAENVITGGSGNDSIDGGAGTDRMIGLGGNDTYFVSRKEDVVTEEAGQGDSDQVLSAASSYTLAANVENLRLIDGGDDARGNALANLVVGNGLANVLDGGAGADELRGGSGNDTFVFRKGEANGDKVADFTGAGAASGDKLQLSGYGAGAKIAQVGTTDFYTITAGDGSQETIQLVGVYNFNTGTGGNDYFFG